MFPVGILRQFGVFYLSFLNWSNTKQCVEVKGKEKNKNTKIGKMADGTDV